MVEFDRGDEDLPEEDRGGWLRWLLLLVLLLGASAPGVVALVLLQRAATEHDRLREEVTLLEEALSGVGNEAIGKVESEITDLVGRLDRVSTRIDALARDLTESRRQSRTAAEQTQRAFDEVGREIASSRRQQDALARQVMEVAQRQERRAEPEALPAAAPDPAPRAEASPPPPRPRESSPPTAPATYTIEPGDTFERLARRFGSDVGAFFDANPGVDPRRLRVGQEINLPPDAQSPEATDG